MEKLVLPKVGLGTWAMGGKREADRSHDEEVIEAITYALDIGYTHIDTAELYGVGHCEELVGQAIKGRDRSQLIIATKVTDNHLAYDDVLAAAERSLKRLALDYIDLYYIHAPNPNIPITETMRAFDHLMEQGLIQHIGVSNFTVSQMKEAQAATKHKIVANQIEYSLYARETGKYGGNNHMESEEVPYCQEQDVYVVAERPLERGLLLERNDIMDEMAEKYGKSYAQIAINWLVSQNSVVTIPKAIARDRLKENFEAGTWQMGATDIEKLRKEYPNQI